MPDVELFSLEKFLENYSQVYKKDELDYAKKYDFSEICNIVQRKLEIDWNDIDDSGKQLRLEREKCAIMGFEKDVIFYKDKIREIISDNKLESAAYPKCYSDIIDAVFSELYGLAGIAPWAYDTDEKYVNSSSAKIIGERIYFMIDGKAYSDATNYKQGAFIKAEKSIAFVNTKRKAE